MTPPWLNSGWTARLRTIFDAPLSEIAESSLDRLVDHSVREDSDLDFKEALYGNGDSQRRELAADIGAMANDRGGIIVIGICEENDVAVACSPVPLTSDEKGRMRAIGAGNIVPFAPFHIVPVPSDRIAGQGYYVLAVPPSPNRPHAVRKDNDLRYPRRHGASKRWLSESEVADAYRDRFGRTDSDVGYVRSVLDQGLEPMTSSKRWPVFGVALAPSEKGSFLIDAAAVSAAEMRAQQDDVSGGLTPFEGPWHCLLRPRAGVGHSAACSSRWWPRS